MTHISGRQPLPFLLAISKTNPIRHYRIPPPHSLLSNSTSATSLRTGAVRLLARYQPLHSIANMSAATSAPDIPSTPPAKWPQPENWPAAKVRQTFIDYFVNAPGFEHTFWPSSGVIPFDDDTLLFANAVSLLAYQLENRTR
jgi:UDP:flavonoid glycosyltransferase YjiC (YdhE family)